jgi:hypothetical protein
MSFVDLTKPQGLEAFDSYIASKNYVQGYMPTSLDSQAFALMGKAPDAKYTHALRFYNHMSAFNDHQRSSFRQGAGVPSQLAGSSAAPTTAPPAAKPAAAQNKKGGKKQQQQQQSKPAAAAAAPAASSPANSAEIEKINADIKAQGDVVRKLKGEKVDKATLQPAIDKLLELKAQLTAAGGAPPQQANQGKGKKKNKGGNKGGGDKGGDNKGKDNKGKDNKGKKKDEKKDGEYDPRLIKAVVKEGGKKGQDILGVYEMGGLEFFCTTVDSPNGDLKLMVMVMDAMNAKIDPASEEKRGGSAEIGKMIFSAGVDQLGLVARVPKDKVNKINTAEWMKVVLEKIGGEMVGEATDEFAQGVAKLDKAKSRFPIKMKDEAIAAGVGYLKEKGCFPDREDSDSDDVCYGDDDFDDF